MIPLKRALTSTVGRKFVMSISGIALVLFVIVHLLGNLTLLIPDGGEAFNKYAHNFESLGVALYVIELGLLSVILLHVAFGIIITLQNRRSRSKNYDEHIQTKGGPSNLSPFSKNMFWSGFFIGLFIIGHVIHFRIAKIFTAEKTMINGEEVTDLYAMVLEAFADPVIVAVYVTASLILGFHLRHGFWSAMQSLGAMKPQWTKGIYAIGFFVAFVLALGFIALPVFLFFIQL